MPRITKKLPADRADYTFGDLVYWHLFKFGTRPDIDPAAKAGRLWDIDEARGKLGVTQKTLRNWIAKGILPDSITSLQIMLFGKNHAWDDAKRELQEKFEQGWMAKPSKGRKAEPADTDTSATAAEPAPSHAIAAPEAASAEPDDAAAASANADGKPAEKSGKRQEKARPFRPIQPLQPVKLHRHAPQRLHPATRRAITALVVILVGTFAWVLTRKSDTPVPQPRNTASETPTPKNEPLTQTGGIKEAIREPAAPLTVPPPVEQTPTFPAAPPVLTEREKQEAAQRQFTEKLIAARQEAHDREVREQEELARRRDAENQAATDQQNQLEADARTVAAIGFRLRENTVAGPSYRNLVTESVTDCALACAAENCDAFAWYRDQYSSAARRKRYCYLYQKPFDIRNGPGHAFGERVADPILGERANSAGSSAIDGRVRLAQVGPPQTTVVPTDDLVRCAGGPVKVTGFKVTCDWILSGGTTLGSARLSYTVANVNECAAKCKAVSKCVGFTFNSGDPDGQHACQIFGPTPEGRESKGWVSGVR
jgi:hypothetical protein